MANFCPKCGNPNEEGVNFCSKCGNKIDYDNNIQEEQSAPVMQINCPICNSVNVENTKFCCVCGARLGEIKTAEPKKPVQQNSVPQYPVQEISTQKNSKAPIIIIIVLALLLLICGGVFAVAYFTDVDIPLVSEWVENIKPESDEDEEADADDKESDDDSDEDSDEDKDSDEEDEEDNEETTAEVAEETTAGKLVATDHKYVVAYKNNEPYCINLRSDAGYGYDVVGTVDHGEYVDIYEEKDGWIHMGCDGVVGWVSASNVTLSDTKPKDEEPEETTVDQSKPTEPTDIIQYQYISQAQTLKGTELAASNVSSDRTFGADRIYDNDHATCWCVNTEEKGGAGAQLKIYMDDTTKPISGISIVNGNQYLPDEEIYASNGQIKDFTLQFSDGSEMSFTASYDSGNVEMQTFCFPEEVTTDYIILTVNSAYVGTKYTTNVCLGELYVF